MQQNRIDQKALEQAKYLAAQPEYLNLAYKSYVPGYLAYGDTKPGDRVLIAIDSNVDLSAPLAISKVLRERGCVVDMIVVDGGVDRPIEESDEIGANIRREPWKGNENDYKARRYLDIPWVTKLVAERGYDLHIQGRAFPTGGFAFRWEGHPWQVVEHFLDRANNFPRELHDLINQRAWDPVWTRGRGSKVHITDPEGTDITYTLLDDYWVHNENTWFGEEPSIGHLMYHPAPPINVEEDAQGVVCGTVSHFARPFPRIKATLERGKIIKVEGGGGFGDGWRELLTETDEIQYPQFPRPGLFYLWEVAVGTNPWQRRAPDIEMVSSGGTEWERFRSGIIHLGFGTAGPSECEQWAGEQGHPYGHLHIHLLFPTVEILHPDGSIEVPIRNGRLTSLDDAEVRALAEKFGDPAALLDDVWIPSIPGISVEGSYDDYAANPAPWHLGAVEATDADFELHRHEDGDHEHHPHEHG